MDKHSQSSDIFSDSRGDHRECSVLPDIDSFSTLVSKTRLILSESVENEILKTNFPTQFATAMEDCATCIAQGLDLVGNLLSDQNLQMDKLQELIEDVVSLLQLLSNYLRSIVESMSMSCYHFAIFPVTTGHMISTVFTHCGNSEILYGQHLKNVESELKNLFKTCHELQVTYLMILDKHFTFDLSNCEEILILIEALQINLKIGEIVQTLDVKSMAEQWKGYTMLCEKYATSLMDREIFNNCTKILCSMTENNIRTALNVELEEKVAVRSVKVASFTIKILLKVCNIFKQATVKNYNHVLELLLHVFVDTCSYSEITSKKSSQFTSMLVSNVLTPCEVLLKELLRDQNFMNTLISFDMENVTNEDQILGYCLLIMAAIKLTLQGNLLISKEDLINSVYKFLPYGHVWFNIGLKFDIAAPLKDKQSYGLYEHLLSHTYALATSLSLDEMIYLEDMMFKAVLGVDCYCALFSANLWSLIAKISTPDYVRSQVSCLWKVCDEMEAHDYIPNGWSLSPQRVHLNYLLRKLCEIISTKKHSAFRDQFGLTGKNMLPDSIQGFVDWNGLNNTFETMFSSAQQAHQQIGTLDKYSRVAPPTDLKEKLSIGETIVTAWTKVCPNNNNFIIQKIEGSVSSESALYLDYIRSLAALTMSFKPACFTEVEQVKILHVASSLIQHGNAEIKLALTNLLFELALNRVTGKNSDLSESIITLTFRSLFQENNTLTRETFYNALIKYKADGNIVNIITNVVADDDRLKRIWYHLKNLKNSNISNLKDMFLNTIHLKYVHQCLGNSDSTQVIELSDNSSKEMNRSGGNNFDFADIDTLFEVGSDSEPACKKVKLNTPDKHEANGLRDVIARLENDAENLCQVKENVFTEEYKCRIRVVCDKLQAVVS